MADDGELVESGTFRVDRKKALEKLKEYQLPDPTMFLLPWVRCAVASGATGIDIHANNNKIVLEVRFDGRPFTEKELRKLYDYLFEEETPETVRNRHLAVGLLTVLRLKPEYVMITSGAGAERACLKVESLQSETLQPPDDESAETILKVSFTGFRLTWPSFGTLRQHADDQYRMGTVPLTQSGYGYVTPMQRETEDLSNATVERPRHSFTTGDVRGWVEVPQNLSMEQSRVNLHTFGVFVERVEHKAPVLQYEAWLNDDLLTLNVSQSGIVQNARLRETLELIDAQAEALLFDVLRRHRVNLADVGRFLHDSVALEPGYTSYRWDASELDGPVLTPSSLFVGSRDGRKVLLGNSFATFSEYWRCYLDGRLFGAGKFSMGPLGGLTIPSKGRVQKLCGAAHVTLWLREACVRGLSDLDKDAANPTLKALWEAPVFFSVNGTPLSLAELELPRRQLGHVPFSTEPHFGSSVPRKAVWCIAKQDRTDLEKFFPDQCEDVTDKW